MSDHEEEFDSVEEDSSEDASTSEESSLEDNIVTEPVNHKESDYNKKIRAKMEKLVKKPTSTHTSGVDVCVDEKPHVLADHDFLGDADQEIMDRRQQKRAEMERIEADPEAYIKSEKIRIARAKAAAITEAMNARRDTNDSEVADEEEDSLIANVSDDGELEEEGVPLSAISQPDYDITEEDDHDFVSGVLRKVGIYHIEHVNQIVININH